MRYRLLVPSCFCLAALTWAVCASGPLAATAKSSDEVKTFMRVKLDHSQKLLEGLALEDFTTIKKEAQELSLLSLATNWQTLQTDEYVQQSREFRRAAGEIITAADEKNLEGAALGYVVLTMKCVRCHQYVRSVETANAGSSRSVPVALP